MALLGCDSFDFYEEDAATSGLWAGFGGSSIRTPPIAGTYGISQLARTGSKILFHTGGSPVSTRYILPGNRTRVGIGAAIYFEDLGLGRRLLRFFDSTSAQVDLLGDTMGAVRVYRDGTSVLLGTSANNILLPGVWNHVEIWVSFSNTAGSIEVRVNEVEVINLTSIDTCATAGQYCNGIGINNSATLPYGAPPCYDDLFWADDTGSINNDFIGDYRVFTLLPNADTAEADWVANTGLPYAAINDISAPDEDATYVSASVEGDRSEYGMEDLPVGYTEIAGAQLYYRALKSDAGTAAIQGSIVSGGSDRAGLNNGLTTSWAYYHDVHETDPATGIKWTRDGINAAKMRIDRTAP